VARGAYSAPPGSVAALGEGRRRGRDGREGRTGKRRRGARKGMRRRLGEGKGGGEGMSPHFLGQVYARGSE